MGNTTDEEIDELYDRVDRMLRMGQFADVDRLLADTDVSKLTTVMMLGHATITFAANNILQEYFPYVARVRARLEETAPEDVDDLLRGLEEKYSERGWR